MHCVCPFYIYIDYYCLNHDKNCVDSRSCARTILIYQLQCHYRLVKFGSYPIGYPPMMRKLKTLIVHRSGCTFLISIFYHVSLLGKNFKSMSGNSTFREVHLQLIRTIYLFVSSKKVTYK
jgi:hypothetical protein